MDRREFLRGALAAGSLAGLGGHLWTTPDDSCAIVRDSRIEATEATLTAGERASISPVVFADLPPAERRVAEEAVADPPARTCRPDAEAFLAFGYRVGERADDRKRAYLERDGTYYRMSVRLLEQVYAR